MRKLLGVVLPCVLLAAVGCTDRDATGPLSPEFQIVVGSGPGKIVVNHDEYTLSNNGFLVAPDAAQFALNVASWFTGGSTGDFLVFSNNLGLTGSALDLTMTDAGHTWKRNLSETFTLDNLLQYDGVFLAQNAADNTVLIDYVNAGGNVFLEGGTGWGGPSGEAARWNTFLNAFGLQFEGISYNGVIGLRPITSTHPIFAGVSELYQNNGNWVSELDPSDPETDILEPSGIHGLYGVFSMTFIVETVMEIDIKPGGNPQSINCNNEHQSIAVAILATSDFDATTVDHITVTFEGASEFHVSKKTGMPRRHEEDVDGDGDTDLVLHFRLGATDLTCQSTEGTLTFMFDGQTIEVTGAVSMIGGPA